jgi:integrase/recombinase XerD
VKNNRFGQAAILSEQDAAKIRRALRNDTHKLFWDIARYTGERWGSIAQLKVGDVYANPVLSIPHPEITFRASTRKASPTGERYTRQVPVHPNLREALLNYNPAIQPSAWLFPSPDHDRPISFSACDKWLRAAVVRAGLSSKGISTHSTRRTLITRLANQGTAIRVIQAITGHADLKALQRYIEVTPDQVKAAIGVL